MSSAVCVSLLCIDLVIHSGVGDSRLSLFIVKAPKQLSKSRAYF